MRLVDVECCTALTLILLFNFSYDVLRGGCEFGECQCECECELGSAFL